MNKNQMALYWRMLITNIIWLLITMKGKKIYGTHKPYKHWNWNEKKLNTIGINCAEDLIKIGSKEAFFRLKAEYSEICLVHLYTLQGAIDDIEFNMLSQKVKEDLKAFNDRFK